LSGWGLFEVETVDVHIGTIEESSVARIRKQYLRLPIYNAGGGEKDEGNDVTLGKWEDFNSDILIYGNFDQITVRCSGLLHRLYKKLVCSFFLANILVIFTISLHDSGNR
jgi:hypothetical protein